MVEAIEEGRIVKVREDYARREGLLILRKKASSESNDSGVQTSRIMGENEERRLGLDDFRKPLGWRKSQVVSELIDNFGWPIAKARRSRNLTRKQVAEKIGESESSVKMIEAGILPKEDFVLINKIQSYLQINLRKDKKDFEESPRKLVEEERSGGGKDSIGSFEVIGSDIEIFEE